MISTVVDNSSGFAGSEAPGSPADVAARHAAFAAAAGGAFSSTSGSSSGNGGGGGSVQQHQQKQEERRLWSRLGKFKLQAARTTSDTPVWASGVWSFRGGGFLVPNAMNDVLSPSFDNSEPAACVRSVRGGGLCLEDASYVSMPRLDTDPQHFLRAPPNLS